MQLKRLKEYKKQAEKNDALFHRGLSKIYSNTDGSLPDISHLDVRRTSRFKIFFLTALVIIILLGGISWLGFILFNPQNNAGGKSLELKIQGPQNIASGDEVNYVLEYKNLEKTTLKNVEIMFRYPDGFEFISANPVPANNFNSSWKLNDLAKGAGGQIEIKGKIIGEVSSLKTINLTASFEPENFNSIFKESASFTSQITSSILQIDLEGPTQILAEQQTVYKLKYRNNSDKDLTNIKILAIYPANFVFQQANPAPLTQEGAARNLNNQWLIDKLAANQEGEIEITGGYLTDDNYPTANFTAQIGFSEENSDNFSLQQEKTINTQILKPGLSVNLIINGSSQDQPINFGQTLTYSVVYKNLGQQDLDDLTITAVLNSDILDWGTLDDKNLGIIEGNKITWSKEQISELDLVRPLDEKTLTFSIQVKAADKINLEKTNLQLKSKVTATVAKITDLPTENLKIESNEITNNINTDVEFKTEGRYFDEDNIAVGSGPLPPVVGQTTTFRIFWSIANSLHEINDVSVTAVLPPGVEWANKFLVKVGSLSYSSKDNTVTWSVGRISPNKTFDDVNAWFDVSVTPTKQQVKKLLILLDETTLTAQDKVTNSLITKTGKAITSNLEDDPVGGGKGLVIDIAQ